MSTSPKEFKLWTGKAFDSGHHISTDGGAVFFCCDGGPGGQGSMDLQDGWIAIQYTGVDDDNGEKLYETDIVATEIGRAVIGFQHGFFCLNWLEPDGSASECNVELLGCNWKGRKREKLVRIGNTYTNPEMITK